MEIARFYGLKVARGSKKLQSFAKNGHGEKQLLQDKEELLQMKTSQLQKVVAIDAW